MGYSENEFKTSEIKIPNKYVLHTINGNVNDINKDIFPKNNEDNLETKLLNYANDSIFLREIEEELKKQVSEIDVFDYNGLNNSDVNETKHR
ncbi:MAG: hypothetical protein IJ565_04445 [Bacilli bacterium]|nr:hypothetical protein [Bacilli bacterium]